MLRDYQASAVDATLQFFREDKGSPLIVAPTGSGKSHIIAGLIDGCLEIKPDARFLIVAHRQELVIQNMSKLSALIDVGVFASGLNKRQVRQTTVGMIGSMWRHVEKFAGTSIIIIDEAHLVPRRQAGMYQTLIQGLRVFNPKLRVVGLTATPFRLDCGHLVNDKDKYNIFTAVSYDIEIGELIEKRVLSPIISKGALTAPNTRALGIRQGEFAVQETEDLYLQVIDAQCEEIVKWGGDRRKWLVFCSSVAHSERAAETLRKMGISAESVTGRNGKEDRVSLLGRFKSGNVQCLCNCEVLTTGFDAPEVDLVALLRPTKSAGLYVQMVGRGMRIADGKENCLLLDFGENILRHGPVDDICIENSSRKPKEEKELAKLCKHCRSANALMAKVCKDCKLPFCRTCRECGHETPLAEMADRCGGCGRLWASERSPGEVLASEQAAMKGQRRVEIKGEAEWFNVQDIFYSSHKKVGKPDSVRVQYQTSLGNTMSKFVCPHHGGFAEQAAARWFKGAVVKEGILLFKGCKTVGQLVEVASIIFKKPRRIRARTDGKFWEIMEFDYPSDEEWLNEVQARQATEAKSVEIDNDDENEFGEMEISW